MAPVRRKKRGKVTWELRSWHLVLSGAVLAGLLVGSSWLLWPFWELSGQFGSVPQKRPSRLYGAPLPLAVGEAVSPDTLVTWLDDLGYRRVERDRLRPGEYRRRGAGLGVYQRSYPSPRGWAPARPLEISIERGRITKLALAGHGVEAAELEPPLLASYYGPDLQERRPVRLAEVPEDLVLAVLAAEDARFFEHGGVSVTGILRATWANLRSGSIRQGGSTLTQQLTKNLFLTHERTVSRKLREAVLAVLVDLRFGKREVLQAYLNEIYLGASGSHSLMGVGAASWAYFGKHPSELTLSEAATLAGMIPAPARYTPLEHPGRARERRDLVLGRLRELEWIDEERLVAAEAEPIEVRRQRPDRRRAPYFADAMAREARDRFGITELADGGVTLLSTLSGRDQRVAEAAVEWGIESLEQGWQKGRHPGQALQAALVSLDPETGEILAYVGGRDYRSSQFDRAGVARRQVGSAFKPVVYAAAFRAGAATPAALFEDSPLTLVSAGRQWAPENSDGRFRGWVSVRTALENSLNVPTVRVAMATGMSEVVGLAGRLGIDPAPPAVPAVALGAVEVTPVELATVYSTFASGGRRPRAHGLRAALTADFEPMSGLPVAGESVLDPAVAHLVTTLLQGVIDRGTGRRARDMGLEGPLAGKTGTTNDRRDSWFAGYAPNRVSVVWVGYDENLATRLSGSRAGLPIWARFTYGVRPPGGYPPFPRPPGVVLAVIDPQTGQLATDHCPEVREEPFLAAYPPALVCHLHRGWGARPLVQPEGVEPRDPQDGRFRDWLRRVFGRRQPEGAV